MEIFAIRCVAYRCFAHPQDAPGAVSTHLLGSCIYGFGIARQLHYTFGWKAHGDGGADANFALQIQAKGSRSALLELDHPYATLSQNLGRSILASSQNFSSSCRDRVASLFMSIEHAFSLF